MNDLAVVCADVGSVSKGNFGWWSSFGEGGKSPSSLAAHVAAMLDGGNSVALGFECPLFVPLVDNEAALTNARPGEGSRAWSAGAGCGALATGLVQVTWILREVIRRATTPRQAFLSWPSFDRAGCGLFLWEAFVTGSAKRGGHVEDAKAGVDAFVGALPDPAKANAVQCPSEVHSLIGSALLRTGWTRDVMVLQEPCLVIKAVTSG